VSPPDSPHRHLLELIRRIAVGDQAALGEFYDLTSRQVFGVARQVLHNDSDAEEVTMAVYLEVWRRAKDYDIQRGRPMTWLLMMARSRAIDALRMQRPGRQLPMESVTNENYPASLESPETRCRTWNNPSLQCSRETWCTRRSRTSRLTNDKSLS
jgi:RNA polymerase sigma factor (sigma-70 family)